MNGLDYLLSRLTASEQKVFLLLNELSARTKECEMMSKRIADLEAKAASEIAQANQE